MLRPLWTKRARPRAGARAQSRGGLRDRATAQAKKAARRAGVRTVVELAARGTPALRVVLIDHRGREHALAAPCADRRSPRGGRRAAIITPGMIISAVRLGLELQHADLCGQPRDRPMSLHRVEKAYFSDHDPPRWITAWKRPPGP